MSIPSRRPALAVLAVVALALAAGVGALIAATGRPGLSVAVAAVGVGLGLNLLLSLRILRALQRISGDQRQVRTAVDRVDRDLTRRLDQQRTLSQRTHQAVRGIREFQGADRTRRRDERAHQLAQIQETIRLFTTIPTTAAVPAMGGWAASADLVGALVDEFVARRPSLVVECGSGVSTLWLALAARHHGIPTRIVALDHDAEFAAKTRATLARHGVTDIAEVRDAPLEPATVDGRDWLWYSREASRDLADIGLLFVDGPPMSTGRHARYPALGILREQLAERCSIVLDDMIRTDEQEIAEQWQETLPDFARTDLSLEKGATIFRRG